MELKNKFPRGLPMHECVGMRMGGANAIVNDNNSSALICTGGSCFAFPRSSCVREGTPRDTYTVLDCMAGWHLTMVKRQSTSVTAFVRVWHIPFQCPRQVCVCVCIGTLPISVSKREGKKEMFDIGFEL